jgi:hypothetical protein
LSRHAGLFHAEEVDHLPLGDVKAQAEFVVEFHARNLGLGLLNLECER